MRTFTTFAFAAGILGAHAIHLAERRDGLPRVIQRDIQRRHVENPLERDRARMRKRASKTVSDQLANEETLYFMTVNMGTPAQTLQLHIDTGSSDLWVNVASSQLCQSSGNPCSSGTYSANDSSTYTYLNSNFNITYEDGSGSSGDYATDVVAFGGISLPQQQFGIGYQSSSQQGILGIGYPRDEVAVAFTGGQTYANVPQSLVNDGFINNNAYSLWLNDLDASSGSILFGGVDTDKYTGSLETLPILKVDGVYAELLLALTAVGANGTQGSFASDIAVAALFDSGTSLMYIPDDIATDIYNAVDARYDSNEGAAFVDCDLANSGQTIDFTFSSPTISVGMDELVLVAGEERGEPICILGIMPAGDTTPVLGDTFLRSAYVVYDIANNQISIAQTDFNSTSENIMEIVNGTGVPDATVVAAAVSTVANLQSAGARNDGEPTLTTSASLAKVTAAVGYQAALLGAAGVGMAFVL